MTLNAHQLDQANLDHDHERECLAPFPLLASTTFCMEVLLRGSVLDLRSVSELLLFDPCALLRIFAHFAEVCPELEDAPVRLENCIAAIGVPGLRRALHYVPSSWPQQARLSSFAEHGVTIGRHCRVAASVVGLCEETAYLLGLFHAVGTLPAILDGRSLPDEAKAAECATVIGNLHRLPIAVQDAISSVPHRDRPSFWTSLVEAAHDLAGSR